MQSIRSAALTVLAHFSKLLVGFFILKLIACYLGAEGLGRLGHFMNLLTILSILAGGGILNGVIKYVAEYRSQPRRLVGFVSSAAGYSITFSVLIFMLGALFSRSIAEVTFGNAQFSPYVIALAVAQVGFAYTNLVIGVSNGLGENHVYAKIQLLGSLLALPVSWWLIACFGLKGAILGLICSLLFTIIPSFFYGFKSRVYRLISVSFPSRDDFRRLFSFTLMLVTSAVAFPLVEIVLRQRLIDFSGYHEAGIWQAATRLSAAYTGLFSVFLAYWFMPIISAEKCWRSIRSKVFRVMPLIMAVFSFGATAFYLWKDFFINAFLSSDFRVLEDVIVYQLVGDFFKIGSYVVGFIAVAKAATRLYICAELIQSLLFISLAIGFGYIYSGAKGVMVGYSIAYFVYFCFSVICFSLVSKK